MISLRANVFIVSGVFSCCSGVSLRVVVFFWSLAALPTSCWKLTSFLARVLVSFSSRVLSFVVLRLRRCRVSVFQVENVRMLDRFNSRKSSTGSLYLTATHLIFFDPDRKKETWVKKTTQKTYLFVFSRAFSYTFSSPVHNGGETEGGFTQFRLSVICCAHDTRTYWRHLSSCPGTPP